jgi:hypothetical protein
MNFLSLNQILPYRLPVQQDQTSLDALSSQDQETYEERKDAYAMHLHNLCRREIHANLDKEEQREKERSSWEERNEKFEGNLKESLRKSQRLHGGGKFEERLTERG